jgi:hypothetical protein
MYLESTTGIIRDYGLPLTVEEYSKAMHPLYLKRFLFRFNMSVKHRFTMCPFTSTYVGLLLLSPQVAKGQSASRSEEACQASLQEQSATRNCFKLHQEKY